MKTKRHSKLKRVIYLNLFCFLTIFILALLSIGYIKNLNSMSNEMRYKIENEWRTNAKDYLSHVKSDLEIAISEDKVDIYNDDSIKKWVLSNADILNYDDNLNNLSVINIGYSIRDNNEITNEIVIDTLTKYKLPNNISNQIYEAISKIKNKSNSDVEKEMINIAKKISKDNKLHYEDVLSSFKELLFTKEKVILSVNSLDEPDKLNMVNSESTINNKKLLNESIVIPQGALGFDKESSCNNLNDNMSYKKLLIVINVDYTTLFKPYERYFDDIKHTCDIISISLFILLIVTTIIISLKFKHMVGGDINDINVEHNSGVVRINSNSFFNRAKQICKRRRKK